MEKKEKELLYKHIYGEYQKDIYHYALKLTKNPDDAEDVVQDSLMRAWNGIEKLRDLNSAKYWLMTIVKREFLRKINNKIQENTEQYEDFEYLIEEEDRSLGMIETSETIKVMFMLEAPYKEVLILQGVYGYKIKEISEILKLNENTVSTRLFRARKKLVELMNTKLKKERKEVLHEL